MKKRRSKDSVLKRQKPQKAGRGKRRLVLALYALAAVSVLAGLYLAKQRVDTLLAGDDIAWRVSLRLTDDAPLTAAQQEEIVKAAKKLLGKGSRKDLSRTAQAIQQLDAYADVHVLKLASDEVAVQVRQRIPVLCIEADRLRLVASGGDVYGQADKDHCPGPVLSGVFEAGAHFSMRPDFTLQIDGDEQALVKEAVELLRLSKERGLVLASVNVQKYRGIAVTLAGSGTEVAMGRAPFSPKLEKLSGILDKYAQKHEVVERIELDYQGKAFIKLKKM